MAKYQMNVSMSDGSTIVAGTFEVPDASIAHDSKSVPFSGTYQSLKTMLGNDFQNSKTSGKDPSIFILELYSYVQLIDLKLSDRTFSNCNYIKLIYKSNLIMDELQMAFAVSTGEPATTHIYTSSGTSMTFDSIQVKSSGNLSGSIFYIYTA